MNSSSESSEEEDDVALVFALAMYTEVEDRFRDATRGQSYLTRADLLPDSRAGTPLEAAFAARNDQAYNGARSRHCLARFLARFLLLGGKLCRGNLKPPISGRSLFTARATCLNRV
jgi:hypothetical protein